MGADGREGRDLGCLKPAHAMAILPLAQPGPVPAPSPAFSPGGMQRGGLAGQQELSGQEFTGEPGPQPPQALGWVGLPPEVWQLGPRA